MWLGAEIAWRCRARHRNADAIVCAVALIGSTPFLYASLVLASVNIKVTYVSIDSTVVSLSATECSLFLTGSKDLSCLFNYQADALANQNRVTKLNVFCYLLRVFKSNFPSTAWLN